MSQQDQMLKAYLERVIAIREQKTNALSEKDLRDIAGEIGLSDEDLLAADRAAQEHFVRGENYLEHGRHDDAIRELQDAVALAPGWLAYKSLLSEAFFERWRKLNREPDRHAAAQLARECIAIDADHAPAYRLLNKLDGPPKADKQGSGAAPDSPSSGGARWMGLGVAGISVLIFGAGALFFVMPSKDLSSPSPQVELSQTTVVQGSSQEKRSTHSTPPAIAPHHPEIPLRFDFGDDAVLEVQQQSSIMVNPESDDGRYYVGQMLLRNSSDKVLSKPTMRLSLLGEGGHVLAVKDVQYMSSVESYRPGDHISVRFYLKKAPSGVKTALLKLESVQSKRAPKAYAQSKPLPLAWAVPSLRDERFIVKERSANLEAVSLDDKNGSYFGAEFELQNASEVEIDRLKVNVLMYDANDKMLLSKPVLVIGKSESLWPKEVRVVSLTFKVPREFKRYAIEVTELKFM